MTDWRRWRLVGACAAWVLLCWANLTISTAQRWYPKAISVGAFLCAACLVALIVRPTASLPYRVSGALAMGTLWIRCVSLAEGGYLGHDPDLVPVVSAQIALTVLLALTYSRWWLTDVRAWQLAHRWHAQDEAAHAKDDAT